jgi:hypothetical protein
MEWPLTSVCVVVVGAIVAMDGYGKNRTKILMKCTSWQLYDAMREGR